MTARRLVPGVAVVVVALIIAGVVAFFVTRGGPTRTIHAEFAEAPGLYKGNHVDVLGVPVGTITAVHPSAGHALVTMTVKSSVNLPADVDAIIMAPQVVADRFVQLTPAYAGGATLAAGATIPVSRTAAPASIDAVVGTLNNLAGELGPTGVNAHGALTNLLSKVAAQLKGNGPEIHSAVTNFSQALDAVAQDSPQVKQLLGNLGTLTTALKNDDANYQAFTGRLASVSTYLGDDRGDITAALSNLSTFFANLTTFIATNQSTLHTSLNNLDAFAQALSAKQAGLAKVFDLSPLVLQNLDQAIDKSAPGGAAIRTRYDPVRATSGLFDQVCGNSTIRFLVVLATGTETNPLTTGTPTDTLCAVGNALNALTPPPGASAGPNLSLSALAAGAR